jgi:hypothetical protein
MFSNLLSYRANTSVPLEELPRDDEENGEGAVSLAVQVIEGKNPQDDDHPIMMVKPVEASTSHSEIGSFDPTEIKAQDHPISSSPAGSSAQHNTQETAKCPQKPDSWT